MKKIQKISVKGYLPDGTPDIRKMEFSTTKGATDWARSLDGYTVQAIHEIEVEDNYRPDFDK